MPFIPVPEDLQSTYDARAEARDMLSANNRTSEQILLAFVAGYDAFWKFGVRSMSETQQALDALGPSVYLPILLNAAAWVADMKEDAGEAWDAGRYDKYLSGPYSYTLDQQTMQLTLTGVTQAWAYQPEVVPVEGGE